MQFWAGGMRTKTRRAEVPRKADDQLPPKICNEEVRYCILSIPHYENELKCSIRWNRPVEAPFVSAAVIFCHFFLSLASSPEGFPSMGGVVPSVGVFDCC